MRVLLSMTNASLSAVSSIASGGRGLGRGSADRRREIVTSNLFAVFGCRTSSSALRPCLRLGNTSRRFAAGAATSRCAPARIRHAYSSAARLSRHRAPYLLWSRSKYG